MTAPKTFGQIAYEAHENARGVTAFPWGALHAPDHEFWERIAAAVALECALIVEDRKVGLPSFFEIDERLDQAAEAIREAISCSSQGGAMTHPLKIENVGEDTYILMSKGHHDQHEFMRAVREAGYDWPLGMPEHMWVRAVPTRDPDFRCKYVEAVPGSRGAFPCTYTWEAYGEAAYMPPGGKD